MENKYGFLRYEYLHDKNFNVIDISGKEQIVEKGDILYNIDGIMYYHDQCEDKLVKLVFDMEKFFDDHIYLLFEQL